MSDFESEFQVALANRELAPEIETMFLMTSAEHMFVSSSIVKEIAALGGPIAGFVSPEVAKRLQAKHGR
jgi:pantetheine-phosphate adenylyltransferase